MKNLFIVLLIVIALFLWNRSRQSAPQPANGPTAQAQSDSAPGGPVRQWQREPSEMMAREAALPQPGSGMAPKAVLDGVRQGLQNSGTQ